MMNRRTDFQTITLYLSLRWISLRGVAAGVEAQATLPGNQQSGVSGGRRTRRRGEMGARGGGAVLPALPLLLPLLLLLFAGCADGIGAPFATTKARLVIWDTRDTSWTLSGGTTHSDPRMQFAEIMFYDDAGGRALHSLDSFQLNLSLT